MVNLALTAEEAKDSSAPVAAKPGDGPKYPYGLCLYLDNATLKKLGVDKLPEVGSVLQIAAKAMVVSVGMNQQHDGDKESRCELQVTDMALSAPVSEVDATALYSNSSMEK